MTDDHAPGIGMPAPPPLTLEDVLEALSLVRTQDGSLARRPVTMDDLIRLLADEMERRKA